MAYRAKLLSQPRLARLWGGAAVCAMVAGLSGCQSIVANTTDAAEVRFVDTSVDAPAVDLYVNGSGAAYNLSYGTFSSYVAVIPGASQISANRANTGQVLTNAHAALAGAHQYTAVVSNHLGSLQENIYPDASPAPVSGMISVRVLNEADTAPLDVYLVPGSSALALASPVVSDLSYTSDDGYVRLPANTTYTVFAIPAGAVPTAANAVTVGGITVTGSSGAVRTLVLSDAAKIEGKAVFGFVLDDSETP